MTRRFPSRSRSCGRTHISGFSMIEVLVALVVLALGLLGFALLQTMNLRYTQSANYRTQATNLAYDLLDQMRANRLSAAQYASATFTAGSVSGDDCSRPTATVEVEDSVARWQCQVVDALGTEASATVTYATGIATVTVGWGERVDDDGSGDNDDTKFTVRTQL